MLKTDDCDIQESGLTILLGGNGDYYIQIKERKRDGYFDINSVRIATSGGKAPSDVKIAVAELYRALEKHNLNQID